MIAYISVPTDKTALTEITTSKHTNRSKSANYNTLLLSKAPDIGQVKIEMIH